MNVSLFEKVHRDLVSDYLKDNPNTDEAVAFLRTKDKAWEITTSLIEKKNDSINKKLNDAATRKPLSGDQLLNDAVTKLSNEKMTQDPKQKF